MTDPVLIIGAGPTGLTAALELRRFGLPVRLVDKLHEPATTSRAIGVQARTLELLDQRGLAAEMLRLGNPAAGGSIYGGGTRLLRLDLSRTESRYRFMLIISQAETERILRDALAQHGVAIERGVELAGIAQLPQDPSPVKATLRHPDGRLEQANAPWLISAEGAHSLVRTTLGLPFEGKTRHEQYALGDVHITGALPETDFHIFSSAHGLMALFPLGGGRYRLIAGHPSEAPRHGAGPSLGELQRIYDERSPIPARFRDMSWSSWFRINSRMVRRLGAGRLLLGGDSAHIHSPAGAQGMNTGIQDMINLGWKLALVMQGRAPATLLDTYGQERLPVMRGVLSNTQNLTDLIGSENPVLRSLFNRLGPYAGGSARVQDNAAAKLSQIAIGYRNSPLSSNHAPGGSLRAGDRVPDLALRHRTPSGWAAAALLSLLDPSRPVLLVAHGQDSATLRPALQAASLRLGGLAATIELAPPDEPAAQRRYHAVLGRTSSVFLVRPDGYAGLAAGGHGAAFRLDAYRQRWFAAGPAAQPG